MARVIRLALILTVVASLFRAEALAQGETTSAIVGEVRDATSAVVPDATVTITNRETGLKRSAQTDEAGRFNFPQLPARLGEVLRQESRRLRCLDWNRRGRLGLRSRGSCAPC